MFKNALVIFILSGVCAQAFACPDFSGKWNCEVVSDKVVGKSKFQTTEETEETVSTRGPIVTVSDKYQSHDYVFDGKPRAYLMALVPSEIQYFGTCTDTQTKVRLSGTFTDLTGITYAVRAKEDSIASSDKLKVTTFNSRIYLGKNLVKTIQSTKRCTKAE